LYQEQHRANAMLLCGGRHCFAEALPPTENHQAKVAVMGGWKLVLMLWENHVFGPKGVSIWGGHFVQPSAPVWIMFTKYQL